LTTGVNYTFRVRASNEVGPGLYSNVNYVIAARVPDQPVSSVLVTSTATSITFSWNQPYSGGSPVLYYKILWDAGLGQGFVPYAFTIDSETTFIANYGLTTGIIYAFRIISVNAIGDSLPSQQFVYVAAHVPG
jgi:hypothetical protein